MKKPKIFIDGYCLGRPSGFGRYIFELCSALGRHEAPFEFTLATPAGVPEEFLVPYPNFNYLRMKDAVFPVWEQAQLPLAIAGKSFDLAHFPYNTASALIPPKKRVVTVHDLTFMQAHAERDLKASIIHSYYSSMFKKATCGSGSIISVSNATGRQLDQYGLTWRRIYNTVDAFAASVGDAKAPAQSKPYFLHRGSPAVGHRNTDRVIEAFLASPDLKNRCALKIFGVNKGRERFGVGPEENVEFLDRVSDAELAGLYGGALAILAPSLLEGFCLPIIEGFHFGAPVVTSNIDPMREIADDAALLVEPHQTGSLVTAMERLASNEALREDLINRGRAKLPSFSAKAFSEQMIACYTEALSL